MGREREVGALQALLAKSSHEAPCQVPIQRMALAVARATSSAVCRCNRRIGRSIGQRFRGMGDVDTLCMADDQDAGPSDEQPGFNDAGI